MRHLIYLLPLLFATNAEAAEYLPEPMTFCSAVKEPGPLVHIATEDTADGYKYTYSNGTGSAEVYEPYAATVARLDLPTITCSTGHCGTASVGPVKPADNCQCGCNAGTCNCAHSPNVGRQSVYLTSLTSDQQSPTLPDPTIQETAAAVISNGNTQVYHYEQVCTASGCQWVRVAGPPRPLARAATAPVRVVRGGIVRLRQRVGNGIQRRRDRRANRRARRRSRWRESWLRR